MKTEMVYILSDNTICSKILVVHIFNQAMSPEILIMDTIHEFMSSDIFIVDIFNMLFKGVRSLGTEVTVGALVRSFSCVSQHVSLDIIWSLTGKVTVWALVNFANIFLFVCHNNFVRFTSTVTVFTRAWLSCWCLTMWFLLDALTITIMTLHCLLESSIWWTLTLKVAYHE